MNSPDDSDQHLTDAEHGRRAANVIAEDGAGDDALLSFDPASIQRPDPLLMRYYFLTSLLTGPLLPIVILPLWFRYVTLQYKLDDEGVSMRWGILFRKEVYLTYRRIQDIHVTKNFIQRWMGLAKISIQTASGSSAAEMTIEGILQPEILRDYLYSKMRGARNETQTNSHGNASDKKQTSATAHLESIRDSMQQLVAIAKGDNR